MKNSAFQLYNPAVSFHSPVPGRGCQVLPSRVAGPGTLHLRFPSAHSLVKAQRLITTAGWEHSHTCGTLSIGVPQEDLTPFVLSLREALQPLERADVRVIFQAQGRTVGVEDFFEVDTLDTFLSRLQGAWLID